MKQTDDKRPRRTSALSGAWRLTDGDSGAEPVIETGLDGGTIVVGPVHRRIQSSVLTGMRRHVERYYVLLDGEISRTSLIAPSNPDPDVKLGKGDLETEVGKLLHARSNVLRHASGDEVRLEACQSE
jgi:hypothetical protein